MAQRRKNRRRGFLGAVIASAVVSIAAGCSSVSAPAATVTANNNDDDATTFNFAPTSVSIATGSTLALKNAGTTEHDLTIDGQNLKLDAGVGKTVQGTVNLAPGTYTFYCSIIEAGFSHRKAGMEGTLTVTPKS